MLFLAIYSVICEQVGKALKIVSSDHGRSFYEMDSNWCRIYIFKEEDGDY